MQMFHLSENGLDFIQRFEGFSALPYRCPAGYWTIGYGALRDLTGQLVTADTTAVSESEARILLARDAVVAASAVRRLIAVPLSQGQVDALVSFTFNLGAGALQRSTLRRLINNGEYDRAATEFPKWVWAGGHKLPGLARRRKAEQVLFLSGCK